MGARRPVSRHSPRNSASASASPWLLGLVRSVEPIGAIFVNAIRMAVVPLVVASLIVGIVSIADQRSLTRLGIRSLVVFAALAISAAAIATLVAAPSSHSSTSIHRWLKRSDNRRQPAAQ